LILLALQMVVGNNPTAREKNWSEGGN